MDFTTNRRLAFIVLIAVIIVFTVVGVTRSVSSLADEIEQGFYDGVYNEAGAYTEKSIQSHLDNRIDAANGLLTLGSQLNVTGSAYTNLQEARYALIDSVTISEKFAANELLTQYYEEEYELIVKLDLTSDQQEMLDYYMKTLRGAANAIEGLSYNDTVSEFYNRTLNTFPVSLFSFMFKGGPEYFS